MQYKLWLHLEAISDDNWNSEDLGWPDPLGSFNTEDEAHRAAWEIVSRFGTNPEASDHQPDPNVTAIGLICTECDQTIPNHLPICHYHEEVI